MENRTTAVVITLRDGSVLELDPVEASRLYEELHSQRGKFMRDFFIDKSYVRRVIQEKVEPLTPMELSRLVGKLWGRLVHPSSPFAKYSSRGTRLSLVTRQNPDGIRLSARNLLEEHDAFNARYLPRVGDITKGRFEIIIKAIERDLGLQEKG